MSTEYRVWLKAGSKWSIVRNTSGKELILTDPANAAQEAQRKIMSKGVTDVRIEKREIS